MKSVKRGNSKGWAEIPAEILDNIVNRLYSDKDYKNSRAVCKSWKSTMPYILREQKRCKTPWIVLPYAKTCSEKFCLLLNLLDNKSYDLNPPESNRKVLCGSCSGRLLIMEHLKLYLLNPFTGTNLELPPLTSLPGIIEYHRPLDGDDYYLRLKGKYYPYPSKNYIRKVISCIRKDDDFMFVLICEVNELAYYSKKCGNNQIWTKIPAPFQWRISDAAFHKGRLHVIDGFGQLAVVNIGGGSGSEVLVDVELEQTQGYIPRSLFLVSSKDELLLVEKSYDLYSRPGSCEALFRIYKLEEHNHNTGGWTWSMVNDLGDQALLLGNNTSLLVPHHIFPGCKKNCIYYDNPILCNPIREIDVSVFHLEEGNIKETVDLHVAGDLQRAVWLLPDMSVTL